MSKHREMIILSSFSINLEKVIESFVWNISFTATHILFLRLRQQTQWCTLWLYPNHECVQWTHSLTICVTIKTRDYSGTVYWTNTCMYGFQSKEKIKKIEMICFYSDPVFCIHLLFKFNIMDTTTISINSCIYFFSSGSSVWLKPCQAPAISNTCYLHSATFCTACGGFIFVWSAEAFRWVVNVREPSLDYGIPLVLCKYWTVESWSVWLDPIRYPFLFKVLPGLLCWMCNVWLLLLDDFQQVSIITYFYVFSPLDMLVLFSI